MRHMEKSDERSNYDVPSVCYVMGGSGGRTDW